MGEGCAGDGEDRNRRVHSELERSCAEKPERVRPDEVCEGLVYLQRGRHVLGEGAELARREIDEMTSRVRRRLAAASGEKEEEGMLSSS